MQKDLFGAATLSSIPTSYEKKTDFLQRYRLNLRLDQIIIGVFLLLVVYVLVFSFGVESGKRYAMAEIKAERAMRERMARELGEKIFANNQAAAVANALVPGTAGVKGPFPAGTGLFRDLSRNGNGPTTRNVPGTVDITPARPGKFMIQTVTLISKTAAEEQLKKLVKKGYSGRIIPSGRFQQVCITGFETRDKASQILGQLKNQGLAPKDAYIRALS